MSLDMGSGCSKFPEVYQGRQAPDEELEDSPSETL